SRGLRRFRRRRFRLRIGGADDPALDLLDDDLLAAAMTEALPHGALLDAALESQRLAANAQLLVRCLGVTHSESSLRAPLCRVSPCSGLPVSPARKRLRRCNLVRKALLAGP